MSADAKAAGAGMRVRELDLLRFFAAFIVLLFHYTFRGPAGALSAMPYPWLAAASKYGYLGVDLFFLISGFVILMTASSGSLRKFVVSRFVRLYPAFWVSCTFTFLMILAFGDPRFSASLRQYLVNLTMLNEFIYVPSIDGVYWSLAVEMQFYAWVALVLLLRQLHRTELLLLAWLAAAAVLEGLPHGRLRSMLIIDYAPYFIAGASCYLVYSKGRSLARLALIGAAWILALRNALHGLDLQPRYGSPASASVILVLITLFFAAMLLIALRRTGFFARRDWLLLGALTYPLYLIHQVTGYLIINSAYPAFNAHIVLGTTIVLVLTFSYMVHVHVERRYSPALKQRLDAALATLGRAVHGVKPFAAARATTRGVREK